MTIFGWILFGFFILAALLPDGGTTGRIVMLLVAASILIWGTGTGIIR